MTVALDTSFETTQLIEKFTQYITLPLKWVSSKFNQMRKKTKQNKIQIKHCLNLAGIENCQWNHLVGAIHATAHNGTWRIAW